MHNVDSSCTGIVVIVIVSGMQTIDEPSIRAAFAQGNPIIDNLPSISGLLR